MTGVRVAVLDDYLGLSLELVDWSAVSSRADITVFTESFASPDETVAALQGFDVVCCMRDRTPLSAETLAQLPGLKFITYQLRGNATLDWRAALAQGVQIANTSRTVFESTSELIWGLILAVVRRIPANDASIRAGGWQHSAGVGLAGKTLGIVGLGKLGRKVASYAQAFGMSVVAWSPHLTDELANEVGVRRVEFDELLRTADIVTVHVALKPETRGLIGAREIALMNQNAYLINTSRGPIVTESALIAALKDGAIAGAGLDVFDREPLAADDPILSAPNTVLTPHIGFVTHENMRVFYEDTMENVAAWLDGTPIRLVS